MMVVAAGVVVGTVVVDGKIACWSGAEVKRTGWEEWWWRGW